MGVCITLLHISKDKQRLPKYMEVNLRQYVLEKAFLMPCNLTSTKELGKLDRREQRTPVGKCGAKTQPLFSHLCFYRRVTHFFLFWPCVDYVAHRGRESGLLNGILSNLLVILPELSHQSVSFMASALIQSTVCVLSYAHICSRESPHQRTAAESQGQAANP